MDRFMNRNKEIPPFLGLNRDEEVIMSSSGLLKESTSRSGWKPGRFFLTNERLISYQPTNKTFQIPLHNITGISTEKKPVVLRTKEVLCLTYQSRRTESISKMLPYSNSKEPDDIKICKAWIAVNNLETWKKRIYEKSLLTVDEGGINKIMMDVDRESQKILSYLWQKKHANIHELSSLYDASNHMDLLFKIREVINPTAERVLGYSILSFEQAKKDDETGKIVTFSWWILGRRESGVKKGKPIFDVFDEGDYFAVIAELSGVREEDISIEVRKQKLHVSISSQNSNHEEEISIPAEVEEKNLIKRYKNNILEVRIKKRINKSG